MSEKYALYSEDDDYRLPFWRDRSAKDFEYQRKLVIFIDILGWKSAILKSEKDLMQYRSIFNDLAIVMPNMVSEKRFFEFYHFSDSFIYVSDVSHYKLSSTFSHARSLLVFLSLRGLLTRGGITIGGMLTDDNIVYGPALVRAYDILERKLAINPRVIADPDQLDELLAIKTGPWQEPLWRRDEDGVYFLDFLQSHLTSEQLDDIESAVRTFDPPTSEKIKAKHDWFHAYVNDTRCRLTQPFRWKVEDEEWKILREEFNAIHFPKDKNKKRPRRERR